jgi:hypothetical protein
MKVRGLARSAGAGGAGADGAVVAGVEVATGVRVRETVRLQMRRASLIGYLM